MDRWEGALSLTGAHTPVGDSALRGTSKIQGQGEGPTSEGGRPVPPPISVNIITTTNTLNVTARIDVGDNLSGLVDGGPTEMVLLLRLLERGCRASGLGITFNNLAHLDDKRRQTLEAWGVDE